MKRILIRLILALFTFFVGVSLTAFWLLSKDVPEVPIPQSEKIRASNFIHDTRISESERKLLEKDILKRFKEEPLKKYSDSTEEIYRLVLLPTFDAPVIIRVWCSGNEQFLTTKKLSGQGGFGLEKFGKLSSEKTQPLTENEWKTFTDLLNQAFFFDLPTLDKNELIVEDGALWVLEGIQGEIFHDVHRITPNEELLASCIYLLKLADLGKEYEGYWK